VFIIHVIQADSHRTNIVRSAVKEEG